MQSALTSYLGTNSTKDSMRKTTGFLGGYRLGRSRSPAGLAVGALAALTALSLVACGGGGEATAATDSPTELTTALAGIAEVASPTFHLAPVDLGDPSMSASLTAVDPTAVRTVAVLPEMASMATAKLLPETVSSQAVEARRLEALAPADSASAKTVQTATVFTPTQIRAAYKLPVVSGNAVVSTAAARAALGAGQTIYIVDAYHLATALSDLNAYSTYLGLPTCTAMALTASTPVPLPAAKVTDGCTFGVAYTAPTLVRSTTPPLYDATWATEIAMDIQSAHAVAPLARIILIEAANPTVTALGTAISLANSMGPGVVSMSFGAPEGVWIAGVDSLFQTKGIQYTASTGDNGSAVLWPAVSAKVLATGGTSLVTSGTTRTETVWSGTGGGASLYVGVPAYQAALSKTITKRRVADVAFDSDPYTGQYIGITVPGKAFGFYIGGGTSIAAPEWAGLLAIASAQRALNALPVLASVHTALYQSASGTASVYAQSFLDVLKGSNGTCTTCTAATGYDTATGLGTPNVSYLMGVLSTVKQ